MAKSIAKSIRLSQELYEYIDSYHGEGFNEKFKNIITDARDTEKSRLEQLSRLDKEIATKRELLANASNQIRDLGTMLRFS